MVSSGFIKRLWNWFDTWFLLLATAFLAVFIPLYPKIPLGDILPGYIVRIRLEDVFIGIAAAWWGIQVLRRKIQWRTPLSAAIGLYIVTGLLANLAGVWFTGTIPAEVLHIGKSMLHWARYIQYFSLYFIAYSAVKNRKQAFAIVVLSLITVVLVGLYGYGQKHWYWPVYSTMNREFSKGMRLYLGPFARVQSTFAGHYDLGAYLVIIIPFALAVFYALGRKEFVPEWLSKRWVRPLRVLSFAAWFIGLWLLVMSASRASFIGYLGGIGLVTLLWAWKIKNWKWFLSRSLAIFAVSAVMLVFVGDLSTRFAQLIDQNKYPRVHATYHTLNAYAQQPSKLISWGAKPPDNGKTVEQLEAELNAKGMTSSDTVPTSDKPSDVLVNVPEEEYEIGDPAATLAGTLVEKDGKLVKERTFSDCALKRSLSLCIRLETLWPQAIRGFTRNPLVGSGYATLTKSQVSQFTEADSTDNNFLRTLGETGALGFLFFYGAVGISMWMMWRAMFRTNDPLMSALAMATFAGTAGLLVNAVYIDVFASSKVAYTFWMIQGLMLAVLVKEGVIGQRFAFERTADKQQTQQLSALLKQMEEKRVQKYEDSRYLSASKQSQKRKRGKKKGQRG
jgi:hypothetical protein